LKLVQRQAEVYRRYPDRLAEIGNEQAAILRRLGREREADELLTGLERKLGRKRDDLAGGLSMARINQLVRDGEEAQAREEFEALLMAQREGGAKLVPLVQQYVGFTKQSDQTEAAAKFMKRFARRVTDMPEKFQNAFLDLVIQAYENDGDTRSAERVRRRMRL